MSLRFVYLAFELPEVTARDPVLTAHKRDQKETIVQQIHRSFLMLR